MWSVTCFVVRLAARGRGLSSALLAGAAEQYHGVLPVLLAAGFAEVARPQPARAIVRLALG